MSDDDAGSRLGCKFQQEQRLRPCYVTISVFSTDRAAPDRRWDHELVKGTILDLLHVGNLCCPSRSRRACTTGAACISHAALRGEPVLRLSAASTTYLHGARLLVNQLITTNTTPSIFGDLTHLSVVLVPSEATYRMAPDMRGNSWTCRSIGGAVDVFHPPTSVRTGLVDTESEADFFQFGIGPLISYRNDERAVSHRATPRMLRRSKRREYYVRYPIFSDTLVWLWRGTNFTLSFSPPLPK